MNPDSGTHNRADVPSVLPPKALLVSLFAQLPLLALGWPSAPARWELGVGGALVLLGTVLNLWSERLFRRGGVGVCPFTPAPCLVDSGPFRVTRNPMYLGLVLICAGVALLTGIEANLAAPLVLLAWLHYRFVLPEEAFLREQLGTPYLLYAASHPRWFGA